MDIAGREVHGLTGGEGNPVQQQGNQHSRISGVPAVQAHRGGQFRLVPGHRGTGDESRNDRRRRLGDVPAAGDEAFEGGAQGHGFVRLRQVLEQQLDQRRQLQPGELKARRQMLEDRTGFRGRPEPAEGLERSQREDHFGLVVIVLVVALRCGGVDAGGFLACEALPGLGERRVHLQGQRRLGREDLEQERQARTESGHARAAQAMFRIPGDQGVQRQPSAVVRCGCVPAGTAGRRRQRDGRGVRVGADPELRFGTAGSRPAQQPGDGRRGAPGVGPEDVLKFVHGLVPV
ncbi:hypothetical protein SRABI128_06290 [Microbacterium sp. Bi128]|nr:hypothetical protein SRABI128_06290 [Microbacterium sp. Bi128]